MYRAYKYRLYPTPEQEELIQKTFGCCRFVYNNVLAWRKDLWEKDKTKVSCFDCGNYVNQVLKNEYPWLREPDKWALNYAVRNLDSAYQNFFRSVGKGEKAGYPKFKSKYDNHKSYTTFNNGGVCITLDYDEGTIKLPKLKKVKVTLHRKAEGTIKTATISQTPSGKYYVSLICDCEDFEPFPEVDKQVGLDLGISTLVTTSDGEFIENPKTLKKYEEKLARLQRELSRKERGSHNYEKTRIKIAKVYEKISNVRKDYLHKLSRRLIEENQVIVSETLAIKEMMHDSHFAKSIGDVSWYELTTQLTYKAQWYGRKYVQLDKKFSSNSVCSECGCQLEEPIKPSEKNWVCPECKAELNRNVNSAKNILTEGMNVLS